MARMIEGEWKTLPVFPHRKVSRSRSIQADFRWARTEPKIESHDSHQAQ